MFTYLDLIYYFFFISALILSFMATEKNLRGLFYLRILLVCGLVNELTSDVMRYYTQWGDAPDHFYIPLEYILLSLFLLR